MKTKPRNKAEQARFDKMKEQSICMACNVIGVTNPFTFHDMDSGIFRPHIEIHHLLSGNKRRGHMFTISLCPWHHRGSITGMQLQVHEVLIWMISAGCALAHGSKPFHAQFGTDKELLDMQNGFLNGSY